MKILVVDHDPQQFVSLAVGLRLQWPDSIVMSATDGATGLKLLREQMPDVVILDVVLPDCSGYDLLTEIRQLSDTPVIVLTARGDETDQVHGLEMGADDYVVKPFGHLALVARIKAVLRRTAPSQALSPDLIAGDLVMHVASRQVTVGGTPVALTPVEFQILGCLVRNAGRFVPHDVLLGRTLGARAGASVNYLKVFVSRIRAKIESSHGPRYIETERGLGYRFVQRRARSPGGQLESVEARR